VAVPFIANRKMSCPHTVHFVKKCITDWYGEDALYAPKTAEGSESTVTAIDLYSVRIHADHSFTLSISRSVGQLRVYSGKFLDMLVDAAEKEFPKMEKRGAWEAAV
jgi:hypothetical protein